MERVAANKEFQRTFLVGALSPQKSTLLWKLSSLDDVTNQHFKQLVADFAGVPYEREMRNAREAAEERGNKLRGSEYDETTWSARTWISFTMQRISCALMRAVAAEMATAMGLSRLRDVRDD